MIDILNLFDKIAQDKKKLALVIITGVIVIYVDFTFILGVQMRSLNSTKIQIAKVKADLDTLNRDLTLMRENKLAKASDVNKDEIKKAIPEGQVSELLQAVSDVANKYKIKILQMKPGYESLDTKGAKSARLSLVTISIQLNSDYHNLARFISDLESSEYFMAVDDMKIQAEQNNFLMQKVSLIIRSYAKR